MQAIPVIAIFDIGKTNKKIFLFDQNYRIVFEKSVYIEETVDEDGFPCENLVEVKLFVFDTLKELLKKGEFIIKALNFTTYGASFVYVDNNGNSLTPLYNYLKPFPEDLKEQFYKTYGGEEALSEVTASPILGSLNSGLQLYRMKYEKPEVFEKIFYALHLPQYMSHLVSKKFYSDITSIGCHTHLWDFHRNDYHTWVKKEDLIRKLAPIIPCDQSMPASFMEHTFGIGVGLHDSSAALIPYIESFNDPFILISTGTWCISINSFNATPLSQKELANDCLSYMNYQGKPIKASRLFAGQEHEQQVKRISSFFMKSPEYFKNLEYNPDIVHNLRESHTIELNNANTSDIIQPSGFKNRTLVEFKNAEEAYHQLILDLVSQQYLSTKLVLEGTHVKQIFVDGGFSKNSIYMNLLAELFPDLKIYAASMAQATALGAALTLHRSWNHQPISTDIIKLKRYKPLIRKVN